MTKLFCFLSLLIFSFVAHAEINSAIALNESVNFISVSDIHFDPYFSCPRLLTRPCPLIQKLRQSPASVWSKLLAKYDTKLPRYRFDSNYPLLDSSMQFARQLAEQKQAKFVLILGDFLGHHYRQNYRHYSRDYSIEGYQSFVTKTFEFLTNELLQAFSNIDVYSVVGNNDSFQGDYYTEVNGRFFKTIQNIWMPLIKDPKNKAAMVTTFHEAGYYSIHVRPNLKIILLNSVLFSTKAKGKFVSYAAEQQLKWFHHELQVAKKQHQKVFIAMHIPPGIDVYATSQLRLFRIVELWRTNYTEAFENELKEFASEILGVFAGHLHSDWFQVLTLNDVHRVPMLGTPAISPIYGNNPGFKLYTYSADAGLVHFETYYYTLDREKKWELEQNFSRMQQVIT